MKKIFIAAALFGFAAPVFAQTYIAPAPSYYPQPISYCPQLSYNLYQGLSDYQTQGQVTALQQFLSTRGYYQPVTGYYGSITANNVAQFQRHYAIYPVTGGVGPLTRAAIARMCGGSVGQGISAYPSAGPAPLTVTFSVPQASGSYWAIQFGDGQSANMLQGPVTHTYTQPGTYTASATSDLACLHTVPQCYTLAAQQLLGSVTIIVSQGQVVGGLTVSSPTQGQVVSRGSALPIMWGYPVSPTSNLSVVLDLYTTAGSKVGTIAVSSNISGTYNWVVPTAGTICTLQYPNGLCGQALSGQYYVQASAVAGSGFDNSPAIATGRSGVFTIQ